MAVWLSVAVAGCLALSGCLRVQIGLAISPDDTVDGNVVIASTKVTDHDTGPRLTVPSALRDKVSARPYTKDGYVGTELRFSRLSFAETARLVEVSGISRDAVRFTLRRAGAVVLLSGRADLTSLPAERADIELRIRFPGDVTQTNGSAGPDGVYSWRLSAGQVNDVSATVSSPNPAGRQWIDWTLLLGAVVVATAVGITLLARNQARHRPYRDRNF